MGFSKTMYNKVVYNRGNLEMRQMPNSKENGSLEYHIHSAFHWGGGLFQYVEMSVGNNLNWEKQYT